MIHMMSCPNSFPVCTSRTRDQDATRISFCTQHDLLNLLFSIYSMWWPRKVLPHSHGNGFSLEQIESAFYYYWEVCVARILERKVVSSDLVCSLWFYCEDLFHLLVFIVCICQFGCSSMDLFLFNQLILSSVNHPGSTNNFIASYQSPGSVSFKEERGQLMKGAAMVA